MVMNDLNVDFLFFSGDVDMATNFRFLKFRFFFAVTATTACRQEMKWGCFFVKKSKKWGCFL